ncbi:hypothetical protein A3K71_00510 [archaeon RBG_16_50_20]|nr:MAG: hypothetical protein A3K71_00510 [archaeon RBG_16_50_20]
MFDLHLVLSSEYLAGLFDSEGSIGAKRTGKSGLTLVLTISNTYLPVLQEVKDTVGYGYFISKKARTVKQKTCFEWRTRNHHNVLDFIGRIKRHARIKRKAIAEVEASIREHRYSENNGSLGYIDHEILTAFHEIMPLREIGKMLGVHHKSVWRRLAI